MKLASFDLEISDELSQPGDPNWPPKISCAAVATHETGCEPLVEYFYNNDVSMPAQQVDSLANRLAEIVASGYTLLTWNGVAFDFQVVADNCQTKEPAQTALDLAWHSHVDMMLLVTFQTGYRLGLDTALAGAGLSGKLHNVTLSDGTPITDMSGAKAPELWRAGERSAVLEYLREDVIQPLMLAEYIQQSKHIYWTSKKGRNMALSVPCLYTVAEAFECLPEPESVSWMNEVIYRRAYIEKYLPEALR